MISERFVVAEPCSRINVCHRRRWIVDHEHRCSLRARYADDLGNAPNRMQASVKMAARDVQTVGERLRTEVAFGMTRNYQL